MFITFFSDLVYIGLKSDYCWTIVISNQETMAKTKSFVRNTCNVSKLYQNLYLMLEYGDFVFYFVIHFCCQDSEDDVHEETEEEFLERCAQAAIDLENGTGVEEVAEEDEEQEIELGNYFNYIYIPAHESSAENSNLI